MPTARTNYYRLESNEIAVTGDLIVNRTCGTDEKLHTSIINFLLTILGPIYFGPPVFPCLIPGTRYVIKVTHTPEWGQKLGTMIRFR